MMFELHNIVVSKDTIVRIASLGQVLFNSILFLFPRVSTRLKTGRFC